MTQPDKRAASSGMDILFMKTPQMHPFNPQIITGAICKTKAVVFVHRFHLASLVPVPTVCK